MNKWNKLKRTIPTQTNVKYIYLLSSEDGYFLSQARARLELREEATKEDAEDIVEIMKYR